MDIVIDIPLPIPIHSSKLQTVHDGLVLIMQNCDDDTRKDPNFILNKIIKQIDEKLDYLGLRKVMIADDEQQRKEEKEIKDRWRQLQPGLYEQEWSG
jgi:hypothetical protein